MSFIDVSRVLERGGGVLCRFPPPSLIKKIHAIHRKRNSSISKPVFATYSSSEHQTRPNLTFPLWCLRFTKLCWVRKHINNIMKSTNSPNHGQPNPRKNRLKVAFGALSPPAKKKKNVGSDRFYIENILQET